MTRPDRESRFDDVDLTTLTIVELEDYLSKIVDRHVIIPDPFFARAYELRIWEVQARIHREVAIRNRRETERQEDLLPVGGAGQVPAGVLADVAAVLDHIALEMRRRARAAREAGYEVAGRVPIARRLNDAQVGEFATAAFEAAARVLLRAGHIVPTKETDHG